MTPAIYSVGHSTRAADELLAVLRSAGIETLVDVRRFPASRRHPQHNRQALERLLADAGMAYTWLGDSLGGRRRSTVPAADSRNSGWQVAAFRAYADYMATPEFQTGIAALAQVARRHRTAFMCAERLWWSCHRRLIADYLTVHGWSVMHVLDVGRAQPHTLTEFARVVDGALTYPGLV